MHAISHVWFHSNIVILLSIAKARHLHRDRAVIYKVLYLSASTIYPSVLGNNSVLIHTGNWIFPRPLERGSRYLHRGFLLMNKYILITFVSIFSYNLSVLCSGSCIIEFVSCVYLLYIFNLPDVHCYA